ncbi:phage pi2 protein 07 [Ureibacillus xyleni]|uniref:Phage pi2 protein 07 n=1 Tax=Ureibacillus xyleni TaxID=614648 RepID=A0A285T5T4_9BACL|nr:DUF771 domain-containing protein [Ureibacillus xyleni]SOC16550.1 phage pi2 protein 07 [Ureibacillus xyleni]
MNNFLEKNNFQALPDYLIISKSDLEEMLQQQLLGTYWSMKDLEKQVNRKHEWIKEHILYPAKFRNLLDIECGGFVYYPKSKGQTWAFNALKMAEFLHDNFSEIFSDKNQLM